jgi:hypothetical protein
MFVFQKSEGRVNRLTFAAGNAAVVGVLLEALRREV